MIRLYFRQAWELLKQNKLFSSLYIVGTALAIAMTVTMAVIYYVKIAPIYPEKNRMNTYYIRSVTFEKGEGKNANTVSWGLSHQALQEWIYPLKNAVAVSATYQGEMAENSYIQPADNSGEYSVEVKLTDPAFFKIYEFRFVEGKPFTQTDLESGICTAVITDDMARRIFGKADGVVGQTFTMNYTEYKVCGVVESASYLTGESFDNIYVPYSVDGTYREPKFKCAYLGAFRVTILVDGDNQADALCAEMTEIQRKFNLIGEEKDDWKVDFNSYPISHVKNVFRVYSNIPTDYWDVFKRLGLLLLVLLVVPALNLSGMISSRMESRVAEMGVRKSFGATRSQLLRQVMWENLVLTLFGGALGLLLAWIGIYLSKEWIFYMLDTFPDTVPSDVDVVVTGEMLFAPLVFLAALLLCIVINLLSAFIPAWNSLRKPIVQSLFEKR